MNPSFMGVFAHLGCVGALQREELLENLTGLAGSSAGANCGAMIASGTMILETGGMRDGDVARTSLAANLKQWSTTVGNRRQEILDPAFGFGIFRGNNVERELATLGMVPRFEDLSIPFACTAWSAYSFRTEVLTSGDLPRAVRASMGVPGLFHPTSHHRKRWLLDGGILDHSGSAGLRSLPVQPSRSLHIIVNRPMLPPLDSHWSRIVPPSQYGAKRSEVVSLRLNRPPSLFLGDKSFRELESAVIASADATFQCLDSPMVAGVEAGHWILEVDVAWKQEKMATHQRSYL